MILLLSDVFSTWLSRILWCPDAVSYVMPSHQFQWELWFFKISFPPINRDISVILVSASFLAAFCPYHMGQFTVAGFKLEKMVGLIEFDPDSCVFISIGPDLLFHSAINGTPFRFQLQCKYYCLPSPSPKTVLRASFFSDRDIIVTFSYSFRWTYHQLRFIIMLIRVQ